MWKKIFCNEDAEMLEQVAQGDGRSLVSWKMQGKTGLASEQPHLVEDISGYKKNPFKDKPFYDSYWPLLHTKMYPLFNFKNLIFLPAYKRSYL